jgi:hypothetical protein
MEPPFRAALFLSPRQKGNELRAIRKSSDNAPASWTAAARPAITAPATQDPPPLLLQASNFSFQNFSFLLFRFVVK